MKNARPASDTALPAKPPRTRVRAARPDTAAMAAAVRASAAPDAARLARLDEFATVDFTAMLTREQVDTIASLFNEHGTYVRVALVILEKDAAGCHEMATALHRSGSSKSLMSTHDQIRATATWLRKTANMMDKAALRVFAGMARSMKQDGFGEEQEA